MPLSAGTRLARYEILSAIGAGGMGEVYRARDLRLDRTVALKVLPADRAADVEARARFDREARAIAALNHPNICALYDAGHDQGHDFLVMELLEGQTLQQRLDQGPLSTAEIVEIALPLADALDTAHGHGLIHRDLKPANVFLTTRGTPKILDFGLAKNVIEPAFDVTRRGDDGLTGLGTTVGTVAYMSPEQLRGEPLDVRTDLFSFGLVLYEMATGKRAFVGATTAVVSAAILGQEPIAPRSVRPDLAASLEAIILKTIEKDRDLRSQSAAELRADLARLKRETSSGSTRALSLPAAAAAEPSAETRLAAPAATAPPPAPVPATSARHTDAPRGRRVAIGVAIAAAVATLVAVAYVVGRGRSADVPPATPSVSPVPGASPAPAARAAPRPEVVTPATIPVPPPEPNSRGAAPLPGDGPRGDSDPGRFGPPSRGDSGAPNPGPGRGGLVREGSPPATYPGAARGPAPGPPPVPPEEPSSANGRGPGEPKALAERGGRGGRAGRGNMASSLVVSLRGQPPETYELVIASGDAKAQELGASIRPALDAAGWTWTGTTEQSAMPQSFTIIVPRFTSSAGALAGWARRNGLTVDYRVAPRLAHMRILIGPQPEAAPQ